MMGPILIRERRTPAKMAARKTAGVNTTHVTPASLEGQPHTLQHMEEGAPFKSTKEGPPVHPTWLIQTARKP